MSHVDGTLGEVVGGGGPLAVPTLGDIVTERLVAAITVVLDLPLAEKKGTRNERFGPFR